MSTDTADERTGTSPAPEGSGSGELRFDGRVVIITGGGGGLGGAHAELLGRRGATVVVSDLGTEIKGHGQSTGPAEATAAAIQAAGGTAVADFTDVRDHEQVKQLIDSTVERFGRLDAVISSHGNSDPRVPMDEMPPERYDNLVRTHLYGTYNLLNCAWPHMKAAGYGRIVLTTSNALFGTQNYSHYVSSKLGIVGLMRSLANDGRELGITVNAVAPGGFTRLAKANQPPEEHELQNTHFNPARASPVYAWLAHESCAITGEIIAAAGYRATRIFIAQTQGATGLKTPEDVRDRWAEIVDETGYWEPTDSRSDSLLWQKEILAAAEQQG